MGREWFDDVVWSGRLEAFLDFAVISEEGRRAEGGWDRARAAFAEAGWNETSAERMARWVMRFGHSLAGRAYGDAERVDLENFLMEARRAGINEQAVAMGAVALRLFYRDVLKAGWARRLGIPEPGRNARPAISKEAIALRYAGRKDTGDVSERVGLFLDEVRIALRAGQYAARTEQTYVDWIKRFVVFARPRNRDAISVEMVQEYLEYLAVVRKVSARTQNQALNALVYLFREVLGRDLGEIE